MNLADLSIKRPTFITAIILLMLAVGYLSMQKLGVDLFPDVTFPVVVVTTPYKGAGPSEIETLVSKPLEDEISTLNGIKRLSSINTEGVSTVIAEFTMKTDIKFAEQQIRDRVGSAKRKLPDDADESTIRRVDPAEQPVLIVSLESPNLSPTELYDVANETVRPKLEQVNQVGLVEVIGGQRREVHVKLDLAKLKRYEVSASQVATRLTASGENVPSGKIDENQKETVFRTLGQFKTLKDIQNTVVNFFGNEVPTTIGDVGTVVDSLTDENSRTYVNGKKTLFLFAFRQSGSNTIQVVDGLKSAIAKLNAELKLFKGAPQLTVVRDSSVWIKVNVDDVKESITIGIILAVLVVYLFLANLRSTIITGLALPNSLIGAFIIMALAGFTINIMSLLALSLSIGLLVDDAIVVRENIFKRMEAGDDPITAAKEGTAEVRLAVIATTMTVIAVFGPVGFLDGVVGQFFKQFGLTICFAMAISLFDALTIAPMLSAYFGGITKGAHAKKKNSFEKAYDWIENRYEQLLHIIVAKPKKVLLLSFLVFLGSCSTIAFVPKTFLPPQDAGEFAVGIDLPPGTSLAAMDDLSQKIDTIIRKHPEVDIVALTVGGRGGDANVAEYYVKLVPAKKRKYNTIQFKEMIRQDLVPFAYANPKVKDYDAVAGGMRPFNLNIIGNDQIALETYVTKLFEVVRKNPGLKDVDTNFRPGKPEFQIATSTSKMQGLGISTTQVGTELRALIQGVTPAKFRENGVEYDVRVRLQDSERNLRTQIDRVFVPNVNQNLVRLRDVTSAIETTGPSKITRQDRGRYLQINADITPGAGMGNVMSELTKLMSEGELKLPEGMRYQFVGQAEDFKQLGESMALALGLGVLFIFLVLASLYESFVTPFTIMLALPLALCGSFVALFIANQSLNIFSMIGAIMLLGVSTKNSILLVDRAMQLVLQGSDRSKAIIEAGKSRLRPILMTTMALIAGTLPIALGLNEASRQRTSMGVAIIGGLISSTVLTLLVVPAAFSYVDRFRVWSKTKLQNIFSLSTIKTKEQT